MREAAGAPRGTFAYPAAERVLYGPGQAAALADETARLGVRRAFVITGRSLATRTDVVGRVEAHLGGRHAGTFAGIGQHAPSRGVAEAARRAREAGADALVSVGGGSPIDAAKLVALALAEGWTEPASSPPTRPAPPAPSRRARSCRTWPWGRRSPPPSSPAPPG
jgi:alcohol dehydrogenase class IV